ncbi:peroxidase [Streptomyces sp. NWU339]|uniref:Dyp-type peroxidase n=1 Tax=Streptomyces sp. NWU339 TaxID=2185284 RepID=UPI000D6831A2|nr:Dyp-type peroxidase [Streptomyces sp. NWU339]PWI08805.1 peroxidase [Streptomyces sp. NWU339]
MTTDTGTALELDDIQAAALMPRPNPYAGEYLALRIGDRHEAQELLRRLIPLLEPVSSFDPGRPVSLGVGLSFAGLEAIGVPTESLATFPSEFQQGMAARAAEIGDVGENAPENWEAPLGSKDVHLVVAALARDTALMESLVVLAQDAVRDLRGVSPVWQLDVHVPPDGREQFGFKDSISEPAVEGTKILGSNPHEAPLKAGEFVLGYEDETGGLSPVPQPEVLGRNGTYVAFRKLHQRVAAFRQYLRDNAADDAEATWLAAKFVGRWPSGAPLALAPDKDDPDLGGDPTRNNAFLYGDDPRGLKCPVGAHARRMNARDSVITGQVRLHRMIRRGTNYGPSLPPGVLEDDGAERGLMFAFVGAHLARQFEFVQKQWVHDGKFIGAPAERDPLIGVQDGGEFTVPKRPIRRRLRGLPDFVVNRGGEYCFLPGLRALRWHADLDT